MIRSARGLAPGTRIDRYELVEQLGTGGFGVVYKARHAVLGQLVALKLLHPEHAASEEQTERFVREARAAAAIGSRHIAAIQDCGTTEEGWRFLAMELLEGRSLEEALQGAPGGLDVDRAVSIALQVLESLAAAHAAGIVHRDLKPANIFLVDDAEQGQEQVKLLDFGVSKSLSADVKKQLTQTGEMLGTPLYMAPEQIHNARHVDHRADIYAAAAVLYEMLSGSVPYDATSYADLIVQICAEPPRPLVVAAPKVPRTLSEVVMKGLAQVPDARWSDAEAFAAAICAVHSGARPPRALGLAPPYSRAIDDDDPTTGPAFDATLPGREAAPGMAASAVAVPQPKLGSVAQLDEEDARVTEPSGYEAPRPTEPSALEAPRPTEPSSAAVKPVPEAEIKPFPPPPVTLGGDDEQSQQQSAAAPQVPVALPGALPPTMELEATASAGSAGDPRAPRKRRGRRLFFGVLFAFLALGFFGGSGAAAWHFISLGDSGGSSSPGSVALTPAAPRSDGGGASGSASTPAADPMGEMVSTVLGTVGESVAGDGTTPLPGDQSTGVVLYRPQVVGQLDSAAIERALLAAQRNMASCRQATVAVNVRIQGNVTLGTLASLAPAPTNTGPPDTARCVADQLRRSLPEGWNPGQGGMFFANVGLASSGAR